MGETLSGIGTTYFAQLDMADSMLEGILNVTTWRQISEGIFGYKPKVTSIFGAPIGISEGTVFVDIDTDTYGVAYNGDKIRTSEVNNDQENEKDSNGDKENKVDYNPVKDFMLYSGFVGSYLESFVLEETVGVFAVSTMEVFKVALSRGMELVKIDSQNSDEFEKIKADDKTLSEMKNAVKAGRTIIVPKEEMCYYGWKGTAYIALDPVTGEGAYMISGSMCGGSTAINIIVGTINVIIAAYDLIAAIDMIILGLANPVLLTVALVFLGVAVYAYIDSMFTLFMYCSTGEERYGEEMMTNLYFNVTFGVITKVAGTLGKKVVRKIGDTLVEMGVDSKYVKNFFTEEFGGVSWDDSPGTGGSGNHGSGSGSHGTGEIPGGGSGNHGSGGTGSGSGSHGTGYIPGGGSPDYWNFIDAWELISKKYGEKVASILQEFGEDGLKLAEKYGDDLARIIDNLEPTEAKKAVSLINSYGDEALEMFKEGKSFDEVKKVVEGGLSESGLDSGLTQSQIEKIVNTPKGSRPDPSSYLSQEYIEAHLAQFNDGVSVIQTEWAYKRYSEINGFVGVPDDNSLFVMPKNYCDDVIERANGNISIIEKELGFPEGYFSDGGGLIRIDAPNTPELNIRIPSGNETGANIHWIPGGKTSGGVPEAITNTIPLKDTTITRIDVD